MNAISSALAGIEQAQTQLASTAGRLSKAVLPEDFGGDSVDLSSEIVSLLAARDAVGVSVAIAHTVEDSDKSLFTLLPNYEADAIAAGRARCD